MIGRWRALDLAAGEDPPVVGEFTWSPRKVYRVLEVRPVESRVWPNRWRVRYEVVRDRAAGEVPPAGAAQIVGYGKGEGPVDAFGPWPDDVTPAE